MATIFKEVSRNLKRAYVKKKAAKRRRARQAASFVKFDLFDLPQKFYQVAPLDWVPGPYQDRLKAVKPVKLTRTPAKPRARRSPKDTVH